MHRVLLEEENEDRRHAMLDAMLGVAEVGKHHRVWAHRADCQWSTAPGQQCPCKPQCLLVLPAANA